MDEQKRPRAWVYARIPGDYDGTMNSYKVCSMQALHDGCDIVGGSIDERGGWLLRPGYRDMLRQIKAGKVDRVYICRMRQISGKERHLYSFFKRLMQHGVQVTATEYSLRDRVKMYEQRLPIEEWKAKKQAELKETIAAQKSALQEVVQDGQRLVDYLYGRGRLGSHITSGNAALVLQTLPQARAVLTAKDWDKFGRRVNKGAKGIPQLVRVNGYYNVGSIFDVSMTYGNKPYPIPEIKPEQMDKAIKELERLSPVNIIFQNEGVVGYDAEQHAIVFPTAMPQREVLARLPAEIVIATAEQHTPGISQAPYLRKTAMAVSVEFCGRFSLPMPDTAAATLDGMDTHIPPGEERKTLEEIRELSVTIGDTVEKALGLQRGQSSPQRDEAR